MLCSKYPARLLVLVAALLIGSCSSSSSPTSPTPPTPPVTTPAVVSPLTITCPTGLSAASTNGSAVAVTYATPTISGGVAPVQVTCNRTSGSLFPVGTTDVQCTAVDATMTTRSCNFTVAIAPPPARLSRTRFLAFGDSITAGEVPIATGGAFSDGSPNYKLIVIPAASYPTQLLTLLRSTFPTQSALFEVINAGQPGEPAIQAASRLPGVLASQRPEVVLLLEGINDLTIGTPGVAQASRSIDTMAKEIRGRGARVFLATLVPSRPGLKATPLALIQSLNAQIQTIARGEGAVLVDLFAALNTDVNRFISFDGLHPTEEGYRKIAETFLTAIRADLEVR